MTIRPMFNLAMGAGLFALMLVIPLFTDLPFLDHKNVFVYISVVLAVTIAFLLYLLSLSYHWIELDGDILRARKLISRRLQEWPVSHIEDVVIPTAEAKPTSQNYQFSFKDGTSIILVNGEMSAIA
ncbi:hypothetical protein BH11PLA2_BH11PLA2_52030 [soil metagenome]